MTDPQQLLTRMLFSTINAREVESDRVSRTLHDEVGQVLSAVGLQLDVLRLDFQDRVPEIAARTVEIQKLLDRAMSEVRALSYDLNPAVVERVGLQNALDRLVGRFRNRFSGSIRFLFDSSVRVPREVGNAWYKIAEHALENALKHAGASKIEVHVRPTPKAITMEVRDDGAGFSILDTKMHSGGLGLLLMEHYAAQAGIEVIISSEQCKGTIVRSTFPVQKPLSKDERSPAARQRARNGVE
jgi:two-component system, NarL family, sensor histidine kinase DegS